MTEGLPITDPHQWLREREQRTADLMAEAERARDELEATAVSITSHDQSVTVTVNASGVLLDLSLSPRAEGMTLTQLSSQIMYTYAQACSEAADRTVEIMSGLIGDDSESMDFLLSTLPPEPDGEDWTVR